jgi:hypothetical protein
MQMAWYSSPEDMGISREPLKHAIIPDHQPRDLFFMYCAGILPR